MIILILILIYIFIKLKHMFICSTRPAQHQSTLSWSLGLGVSTHELSETLIVSIAELLL